MVDANGARIDGKSISFEYGTVNQSTVTVEHETGNWSYDQYAVNGNDNANALFTFMADNTKVEFSYGVFGKEGGEVSNFITTTHGEKTEGGMRDVQMKQNMKDKPMTEHTHSHPKQFRKEGSYPSGLPDTKNHGTGDIQFAKDVINFYNIYPKFNIYLPFSKEIIKYGPNSVKSDYKYFNK